VRPVRLCCTCLAAGLLVGVTPGLSGEDTPLRVLFPADHAILTSGRFELLCVVPGASAGAPRPRLRVDGKEAKWEPYELPVLVSRLAMAPGPHQITVGPVKLQVWVRGDRAGPGPAGWPVLNCHPGGPAGWRDCSACHEVTRAAGRAKVGQPREPAACAECHPSGAFELAHFHPARPLAACHQCHALHGSTGPSLLKAPPKQLCAKCHD